MIRPHYPGNLKDNNKWPAVIFSKNHAWAIIDKASVPVLAIPYQVRFKSFGTIAFASALKYTYIAILQLLTGMAKYSGAELLVAHMAADSAGNRQDELELKRFFTQILEKWIIPGYSTVTSGVKFGPQLKVAERTFHY